MPKLETIENSTPTNTPESGSVITYFAVESGALKLKAKKSDGTVVTVLG